MRKLISILLVLVMAFALFTACGADGKDGTNGVDGKDGISPQMKIGEDNVWYVSYDAGATWQSLNVKATGEAGAPGEKGEPGEKGAAGDKGKRGTKGEDGESNFVWVKYADAYPTGDADLKDDISAYMGIYNGESETAPTSWEEYTWFQIAPAQQDEQP